MENGRLRRRRDPGQQGEPMNHAAGFQILL
jgi:hypothetical protein